VPAGNTVVYPTAIESDAPAYLFAWAIGDYAELPLGETSAGTSVSMWHKPGGKAAAAAGGAHLVAAFDWLEQRLGPYRFGARVGSVAAPWIGGGMEHHPFWHVAETSMSDEAVQMHEAAHGWFGDGVRLKCWEDLVLSEGTATYLAARVAEDVVGTTQSDSIWQSYQAELDGFRQAGANHRAWPQSCGIIDVLKGDIFSRSPYIKGAFFYRGLEQRVGREPLDEALKTFYERFAGRAAGMQDMLDVIAEITGYDPAPCAEAWLIDAASVPKPEACP
jgi:aminopeptidase N